MTIREYPSSACPKCGHRGLRFAVDRVKRDSWVCWEIGCMFCRGCYEGTRHASIKPPGLVDRMRKFLWARRNKSKIGVDFETKTE